MPTHDTTMHEQTPDRIIHARSREQLSALMDGALSTDETRFLLRRLQHDATLGECWERWRLAGETMRGLAPSRRLPADFSARVAAALACHETQPAVKPTQRRGWLRWGGGAAVAASLAVAALALRQSPVPESPVAPALAASAAPAQPAPRQPALVQSVPVPATETSGDAGQALASVAVAATAAVARPARASREAPRIAVRRAPAQTEPAQVIAAAESVPVETPAMAIGEPAFLPVQGRITTKPWPRALLPQYAGNSGLTVGFGQGGQAVAPFDLLRLPAAPSNGALGTVLPTEASAPEQP